LGDHHSGFIAPEMVSKLDALTAGDNPSPEGKISPERLPMFACRRLLAGINRRWNQAAIGLQAVVQEIDAQHPCGWVVDLSNNGGV
jgi:hypothetical protein